MKKPERVKQRVAKTVHIISAKTLGVSPGSPSLDRLGLEILAPFSVLVGLYCMAVFFSKMPVLGRRAAWENLHAYEAWSRTNAEATITLRISN
jgi:hypothetical protein